MTDLNNPNDTNYVNIQEVDSETELSDSESDKENDESRDVIYSSSHEKEDIELTQVRTSTLPLIREDSATLEDFFPSEALVMTSVEMVDYAKLPSRTRHSSRRRRQQQATTQEDVSVPGPALAGDIELHPVQDAPPDVELHRAQVSRSSLRRTLKQRSQKSLRRGPESTLNIMDRRTLRREELNQMDQFEIKNLPVCTKIGYKVSLTVQKCWRKVSEGLRNFRIWGGAIREVEGNLGSSVSTYFRVLRWLLMINALNLIVALSLITTPGIYILHGQQDSVHPPTLYNADDMNCTNPNFFEETTKWHNITNSFLQFLTGTGWMEKSALYIGWYPSLNITSSKEHYLDIGCHLQDKFRCYTFDNRIIGAGESKRWYDARRMDYSSTNANFTGDKYQCDINCLDALEPCSLQCYTCEGSCVADLETTAHFNDSTKEYTCFDLPPGATYGLGDCQFNAVAEGVGLKCDGCRRNHVMYHFALAYVLVGLSYFVMSLLFVFKNMLKIFKKSATEMVGYTPYTEMVFGGWDYNISNKDSALLKSRGLLKSMKEELTSDDQKKKLRSTKEKFCILLLRLFTNFLCVGAMGCVVFLYYDVYRKNGGTNPCDVEESVDISALDISQLTTLWDSYAPAIIVSGSNVIFPIFFEFLGSLERYQFESTRINITMARSFLMKLFSIISFLYILYSSIDNESTVHSSNSVAEADPWTYNCWENWVGTELYRLVIIDFCVFCMAVFLSEWCRRFVVDYNRFFREKFDVTEFNISKEVLDICYKQMIFWSAIFFCPLISVVAFIEIILIFYLKKISALRNVKPPEKVILNSSSSSIINGVFIISLLVVFVPIGYIIFNFEPSTNCGPFAAHPSFVDPFNLLINKSGIFKSYILENLKTTSVVVVLTVITIIIIYYFYSLAQARKLTIYLLKEQIKVENADKKFLIEQMRDSRAVKSSSSVVNESVVHFKLKSPTSSDPRRTQHNLMWYQSHTQKNKKKKRNGVGTYANPNIRNV